MRYPTLEELDAVENVDEGPTLSIFGLPTVTFTNSRCDEIRARLIDLRPVFRSKHGKFPIRNTAQREKANS